jgi:hypothetical protein
VLRIVTNDWQRTRKVLLPLPGVVEVQSYGDAVHVLMDSIENRSSMIRATLEDNNLHILELREITPRMEEAFISFIHKLEQEI